MLSRLDFIKFVGTLGGMILTPLGRLRIWKYTLHSHKFRHAKRGSIQIGIYLILALALVDCASPASPVESPTTFSTPAESEVLVEPAKPSGVAGRTIGTRTAPQATATLAPVTETPTKASMPLARIKPFITAKGLRLRFDSWAPDSLWIAYWLGEEEERPASLAFANVDSGETCQHKEVIAQDIGSGRVIRQEDGSALILSGLAGEAQRGVPCGAFALVEHVAAPRTYGEFSPDGSYFAERIILKLEEQAFHTELRITELGTGQTIVSETFVDSPHLQFCGPRWLNNELYLIGRTVDQGVLYYSVADDRVGHVFPDLLGSEASEEENVSLINTQVNPDSGEYHLLLGRWGDPTGSLLYHSELDQLEELPSYYGWTFADASGGWGSFSPDGRWLLLYNQTEDGDTDYWLRLVDPPGSPSVQIANPAHPGGMSSNGQLMAFFRLGHILIVSFPDGRLLSRWYAPNYWLDRLWWSPDGSRLVAYGSPLEYGYEALFVIEP